MDDMYIAKYWLDQAIADGFLVEVLKHAWEQLSCGKPIVATRHLSEEISLAGLVEIWNEFVAWRQNVMKTLPEEEQMFVTTMNGNKIWVVEEDAAFTMMYPEDY